MILIYELISVLTLSLMIWVIFIFTECVFISVSLIWFVFMFFLFTPFLVTCTFAFQSNWRAAKLTTLEVLDFVCFIILIHCDVRHPVFDSYRQISLLATAFSSVWNMSNTTPGPLFTKRADVLLQDLVKSRSCEMGCYEARITLKFDRHLGSAAAELPVKFLSDWKSLNPNLAALKLCKIFQTSVLLVNRGPVVPTL